MFALTFSKILYLCTQYQIIIKSIWHTLTLAGIIVPVVHSDGNGLPLGAEENANYANVAKNCN